MLELGLPPTTNSLGHGGAARCPLSSPLAGLPPPGPAARISPTRSAEGCSSAASLEKLIFPFLCSSSS